MMIRIWEILFQVWFFLILIYPSIYIYIDMLTSPFFSAGDMSHRLHDFQPGSSQGSKWSFWMDLEIVNQKEHIMKAAQTERTRTPWLAGEAEGSTLTLPWKGSPWRRDAQVGRAVSATRRPPSSGSCENFVVQLNKMVMVVVWCSSPLRVHHPEELKNLP